MAWISLTASDVEEKITGPELDAFQTWHLQTGQADPLPDTIEGVVREIRGRVAACTRNTLGIAGTIPEELYSTALTLILWRAATRLPGCGPDLLDASREKEYDNAQELLRDVAACRFAVEQPSTASCTPDSNNENSAGKYGGSDILAF